MAGDGEVTEEDVLNALQYLIDIEPDPLAVQTAEEYKAVMAQHKAGNDRAIATLRAYAEQMQPADLLSMQREFYTILDSYSGTEVSVVTAALNEAWHGIGPWLK